LHLGIRRGEVGVFESGSEQWDMEFFNCLAPVRARANSVRENGVFRK
jgi:hypothetical protein